uniref:Uncharacterized protein n=1 Tax=Arundo donax TaxID=35708 RepID=A0A0A9HBJ2_ARUDO
MNYQMPERVLRGRAFLVMKLQCGLQGTSILYRALSNFEVT